MATQLLLPCLSLIWFVVVLVVVGEYISLSSMAIGTIILHNGGFVVLGNHGRHPLSFSDIFVFWHIIIYRHCGGVVVAVYAHKMVSWVLFV